MTRRLIARFAALGGAGALLICAVLIPAQVVRAATAPDVTVKVVSVSPDVPPATTDVTPLTVNLELTNTTSATLSQLRIDITREPPISSAQALRRELASPVEGNSQPFRLPSQTLDGDLGPRASRRVTLNLSTSTDSTAPGSLCLCRTGVYPLDFAVHASGGSATGSPERGWGQTYIPSVADVQINSTWLWPFFERPHRMISDTLFVDDALAQSVSAGGRLDRALAALERASNISNVTLVLDPELLDELVVMTQGYRVQVASGAPRAGTGGHAAQLWLERLKAVLARAGGYSFSAYADPDVDALTEAGIPWASTLPTAMAQRISLALELSDRHDIAWPAGQTVSRSALSALATSGVQAVLLDDATLPGAQDDGGGHVTIPGSPASALVVSRGVNAVVSSVVSTNGGGLSALPAMVSSALMPAIEETNNFVVLTPDRYADVDPSRAAAAIDATTTGPFRPVSARTALTDVDTYSAGDLVTPNGAEDAELSQAQLQLINAARASTGTLAGALGESGAATVLAGYPEGIQRAQSSAWRQDRSAGLAFAGALAQDGSALSNAVRIVRPSQGSYSLASSDSPLYLYVRNELPVPVSVKVAVAAVGDVRGFSADPSGAETIQPGSVQRFRVQAHVERSGHFTVAATLTTPSGVQVGPTERLSIYSKALGTIGVVITFVAGSVLAVALLVRFSRRFRNRARARKASSVPAGMT